MEFSYANKQDEASHDSLWIKGLGLFITLARQQRSMRIHHETEDTAIGDTIVPLFRFHTIPGEIHV